MKISVAVFLSLSLCLAAVTQAAAEPYFKAPVDFNGTGCPNGSTTTTGVNSPLLTVMFNQYDAAKPQSNSRSKSERTACSFAVPVHVPPGWQVSLLTATWMGYAKGQTELFRRYTMLGINGGSPLPPQTSYPQGNFKIDDEKVYSSSTFSPCGKDVQLRINSSVTAKGNDSYIQLNEMMRFNLKWQKCQ